MDKVIYPVFPIIGVYDQSERFEVSVIVPLYKSNEVIEDQINSWFQDEGIKTEIIYVDDRCPTKSKSVVYKEWNRKPDKANYHVTLVLSGKNRGFAGACNLGAMHARGKYLIFLNADTIVTPNWIKPMIDLFDDPKVGIVGNLQIKEGGRWDGTIDSAGSEWSWEFMNFMHIGRHFYNGKPLERPYTPENAPADMLTVSEREMVTGCCLAIPKDLYNEAGGFDQEYKVGYWEDSALNMEVKNLGYKVMFTPHSMIYHKLSHSNIGFHPFHEANRIKFFDKWVLTEKIDQWVAAKRPEKLEMNEEVVERLSSVRMTYYRETYKDSTRWNGKDLLEDKTVLVYCEQGLGDTIQFVRYIADLRKLCKKVVLHCATPLHDLLKNHVEGVDEVFDKNDPNLPEHDYHVLSMSLPFLLKDSKPETPYIQIQDKTDLGYDGCIKIGIAWEGSPEHSNNSQRSCELKRFRFLEQFPNAKVFMVQDQVHEERWLDGCDDFEVMGVELNNFVDTAKLLNSLDIIICVDTSILHLAGAMNKKAFGLLSIPGDARWDVHEWYPTVELIKQFGPGDWDSVFKELEQKVKELV